MISQLTVFLENEKGRLAAACRTVSDAGDLHSPQPVEAKDLLVDQTQIPRHHAAEP